MQLPRAIAIAFAIAIAVGFVATPAFAQAGGGTKPVSKPTKPPNKLLPRKPIKPLPPPVAAPVDAGTPEVDAGPAEAKDEKPKGPPAKLNGKPINIKMGIYLLNIGDFNVAAGTFTADFYLSLRSDRPMPDLKLEFMNGRAADKVLLNDDPTEKIWRIQAKLMANLDLRRYPWDEHDLPIVIEDGLLTEEDLVFSVDEERNGVDPAVIFVGWILAGVKPAITTHTYTVYDNEKYSVFTDKIHIGRLVFISSLKTFLPVLCFLLVAFAALLVTLERLDSRVGMNTAMLIASVMFHLSITNQLPPSAYLTIADKVLVATYMTIGLSLLTSVLMMRLMQKDRAADAKVLRDRSFKIVPGFAVLAYLVVALTGMRGN